MLFAFGFHAVADPVVRSNAASPLRAWAPMFVIAPIAHSVLPSRSSASIGAISCATWRSSSVFSSGLNQAPTSPPRTLPKKMMTATSSQRRVEPKSVQ